MTNYLYHLLVALDQLANALLLGHADETLSARAWRVEQGGKVFGMLTRPIIDIVFLVITFGWDKNHCRNAYDAEVIRKQFPKTYQTR